MSVELATSKEVYDVDFEGRNFAVVFETDHNSNWTETYVLENGEPPEAGLADRVIAYTSDCIENGKVS